MSGSDKAKNPDPFSLRLTAEEKALLKRRAGQRPLGTYIREQLLGDHAVRRKHKRRAPTMDQEALGKLLGALGQSRLASNMNQLARAANAGDLQIDPDICRELNQACADIRHMRLNLLKALGLRPKPSYAKASED